MDHSISLYNIMVSSHQSHTWDQGPLYLPIQHHGVFSPIPYMRPWTTLSVYTTSWSLLTNPIHETRDHSICLYNTMSHEYNWWEETMVLYRQIEWSLFSCIGLERRDHVVAQKDRVGPVLLYRIGEKRPCCSWDQGPLYLSMRHHGLFSPSPYMRREGPFYMSL
jgi:hypothetical protein